jgi:hypothetical protein
MTPPFFEIQIKNIKEKIIKIVIYLLVIAALVYKCDCEKKKKEKETMGSIYGVIIDKTTGEPVRSAGVELNTGIKTITSDKGKYEFLDLKGGDYTITVTKTGYTDLIGHKITIETGKASKGDVQIEKQPSALRIVNDKAENIDTITFGSEESLVTRSFNIFNDSPESLEWIITENCNWIELIPSTGTLQPGKQQAVVISINREKLTAGINVYLLTIFSENGAKELTITATAISNDLVVNNIAVQEIDISAGEIDWTRANNLCQNSTLGGHNNWRLPTLDELLVLYKNRDEIGDFKQSKSYDLFYFYWSSTPPDYINNLYYALNMTNGDTWVFYSSISSFSSDFDHFFYARCVRSLP